MNVTFEKKDELNGTISVNITTEDYLPAYEKKLKDYGKKANIPGFRAGHAPKSMIEKMVGNSLLLEEVNGLASKGLFDYMEENKMNVLGQPVLSEDTKIDALTKNAAYTFNFDLGLSPDIQLNISAADTYEKYKVVVSDKMIDEEVARMVKQNSALTNVEIAEENDLIYAGLTELSDEGNELEGGVNAESVPIAINTIKDEEVRNRLTGLEIGAEFTVNIFTLFNNDEVEMSHALNMQKNGIPDLNPEFKLKLNEIKRTETSIMNQEFFDKIYGKDVITSEGELRTKIQEELSAYFDQQAQHLLEHELFDALVAKHKIELPDAFLKRWLIDRHADKFNSENVEMAYLPEAKYLRNHIFEEKILVSNGIKIDEEEIKQVALAHTKNMFSSYGNQGISDELLMSIVEPQLKKEDFRSRMINVASRARVNEYLMNTLTIEPKEISVEDFIKVMEIHNHKHHENSDNEQGNEPEEHGHDNELQEHNHSHEE
ncbi:MAG: trigger factor [Bacteroidia bacterium]|nr:trigger factor [Bacteroidia bacterium]